MTGPIIVTPYDLAYARVRRAALRFNFRELHYALRLFASVARTEEEWGAMDALADLFKEAAHVTAHAPASEHQPQART